MSTQYEIYEPAKGFPAAAAIEPRCSQDGWDIFRKVPVSSLRLTNTYCSTPSWKNLPSFSTCKKQRVTEIPLMDHLSAMPLRRLLLCGALHGASPLLSFPAVLSEKKYDIGDKRGLVWMPSRGPPARAHRYFRKVCRAREIFIAFSSHLESVREHQPTHPRRCPLSTVANDLVFDRGLRPRRSRRKLDGERRSKEARRTRWRKQREEKML